MWTKTEKTYVQNRKYTSSPDWEPWEIDKNREIHNNVETDTPAKKDLYNYYNGKSKYVKGKGWAT